MNQKKSSTVPPRQSPRGICYNNYVSKISNTKIVISLLVVSVVLAVYYFNPRIISNNFMISKNVSQEIISEYCGVKEERQLTVMKDNDGNIGAYIVRLPIDDAPLSYIDPHGKQLAFFYIFGTDEEKEVSSKIINDLEKKFPNSSAFVCPNKLVS